MQGPSHEQLAYFLTRGRNEPERKEPSVDEVNHLRTTIPEYKFLSNPEIIRRHYK
jgi:hypothetical protein